MGTHKVHNSFYNADEEMYDEPRPVVAETDEQAGLPTQPLIRPQVFDVEPNIDERRIKTMTAAIEITVFKIKVQKFGNTRVSTIEFHAAGWSEAVEYGKGLGRLLSVSLANEK